MARNKIKSQAFNQNFLRVRGDSNTTASDQENVRMEAGWGFVLGNNTASLNKNVTFPTSFTTVIALVVNGIGYKDSSDPSGIGDFAVWDQIICTAGAITTTQFTVQISPRQDSVTIANTRRVGFSYIVLGT